MSTHYLNKWKKPKKNRPKKSEHPSMTFLKLYNEKEYSTHLLIGLQFLFQFSIFQRRIVFRFHVICEHTSRGSPEIFHASFLQLPTHLGENIHRTVVEVVVFQIQLIFGVGLRTNLLYLRFKKVEIQVERITSCVILMSSPNTTWGFARMPREDRSEGTTWTGCTLPLVEDLPEFARSWLNIKLLNRFQVRKK